MENFHSLDDTCNTHEFYTFKFSTNARNIHEWFNHSYIAIQRDYIYFETTNVSRIPEIRMIL